MSVERQAASLRTPAASHNMLFGRQRSQSSPPHDKSVTFDLPDRRARLTRNSNSPTQVRQSAATVRPDPQQAMPASRKDKKHVRQNAHTTPSIKSLGRSLSLSPGSKPSQGAPFPRVPLDGTSPRGRRQKREKPLLNPQFVKTSRASADAICDRPAQVDPQEENELLRERVLQLENALLKLDEKNQRMKAQLRGATGQPPTESSDD